MPWKPSTYRAKWGKPPARRSNPHRRLLWTKRYRRFRVWLLEERPICERCRRHESVDVHHVRKLADHPEDLIDAGRCEALCHACHSRATAAGE